MREIITLIEEKSSPQDIEIIPLNFEDKDVSPVLSKDTLNLHYGKLAHGYADRYNKGEGDKDFNYAGVFLHNLLFTQFREVRNTNKPNGPMLGFIKKHFGNYDNMKDKFEEEAMKLQGSNWIYLAHDGSIKTIKNHDVRNDILLLIDWWEHAWLLDYGSDKKKYLKEQWKIINWNVINTRWGKSL
ncbi:SodA Superoxide dismutase [uncultured Caudovirales phage]|uniref:superoxide dismutase n=1 Tax=uncultured Caudovirales phage TaxID=2100421 RepID=A0A6J5LJ38_9CAUD|nr:SodA Superoxide dismutase [uncultured Caudovirales phage]